jgi:hypothetical protein
MNFIKIITLLFNEVAKNCDHNVERYFLTCGSFTFEFIAFTLSSEPQRSLKVFRINKGFVSQSIQVLTVLAST